MVFGLAKAANLMNRHKHQSSNLQEATCSSQSVYSKEILERRTLTSERIESLGRRFLGVEVSLFAPETVPSARRKEEEDDHTKLLRTGEITF